MSNLIESARMVLPIPAADRQQALERASQQVVIAQQQPVFYNQLAVQVTQRYLDLLGIESEWRQNAATALSANLSDLYIPEARGRLDCRAVLSGAQKCQLPAEAWADRIGLVVVQLNAACTVGTLLGFVPEARVEELPLSYLQPLEMLFDHLSPPVWLLSEWLAGRLGRGWERLPDSSQSPSLPASLAWNYRSRRFRHQTEPELVEIIQTAQTEDERWDAAERLRQINPQHPNCGVWAIDLAMQLAGQSVALMVAILTVPQGKALLLRLYPIGRPNLPLGLRVVGRSGPRELFDLPARAESQGLQYRFLADAGDRFEIEIALGSAKITEYFVV